MPKLLTKEGCEVLVDQDTLDRFGKYTWSLNKRGDVFSWQPINGKRGLYLRKLVLGEVKNNIHIRHINGNSLDCRRANLSKTNVEFEYTKEYVIAKIPGKPEFLISKEDVGLVSNYFWSLMKCGYIYSPTLKQYLHRVITDCADDLYVDHINRNKLDNRRSNLRVVTNSINQVNRPKQKSTEKRTYTSPYKGVERKGSGKFSVRVRSKRIGTFTCEIAAANAYNYAAKRLFGEYVVLNDVPVVPESKLDSFLAKRRRNK
ncbi:HNH endonuclease signature motif containing protein [Bacillus velezensis]|uniref:HNH endonuclease signature motif containing protein n=1 Tax=Bacillus velezensis TaxID=492670 RepID=UPI003AB64693